MNNKRGNLYLVGWILFLIVIFVSFIIVLEFEHKKILKFNEGVSNLSEKEVKEVINISKENTSRGIKTCLSLGGIFSIAGIIYLIYWVLNITRSSKKDFSI